MLLQVQGAKKNVFQGPRISSSTPPYETQKGSVFIKTRGKLLFMKNISLLQAHRCFSGFCFFQIMFIQYKMQLHTQTKADSCSSVNEEHSSFLKSTARDHKHGVPLPPSGQLPDCRSDALAQL